MYIIVGLYHQKAPLVTFNFWRSVFIFGTIIAHGVNITRNVSDHWYSLGVKGQGHKTYNLSWNLYM